MITLFGATGYTGRLVAQALSAAGLELRLAGRDAGRLARLSAALPAAPPCLVADARRPATLAPLFDDCRLLVNCAGPFSDLGEPLAAQAARRGVHYLDTANELSYVHRLRGYDAPARQSGAALVPTCGLEVALSDCAAAVLGRETGPLDELRVTYAISGRGSSLGTRRSAVRALATSWLGYRDGAWRAAVPGRQVRRVDLPGGPHYALAFPSSEIATVPTHLSVRQVTTWLTISPAARYWAPLAIPAFAWLARGPLGGLTLAVVSRVAPPPPSGLRSQAPFWIQVKAVAAAATRTLTLSGRGVYELTAAIVAYAAQHLLADDFAHSGVLAPAAALDPAALLAHAAAHWNVTVKYG